jgi:hypothetical protein
MGDLFELHEELLAIDEQISNFFDGDDVFHSDSGYQELLERRDEIQSEIDNYQNN